MDIGSDARSRCVWTPESAIQPSKARHKLGTGRINTTLTRPWLTFHDQVAQHSEQYANDPNSDLHLACHQDITEGFHDFVGLLPVLVHNRTDLTLEVPHDRRVGPMLLGVLRT